MICFMVIKMDNFEESGGFVYYCNTCDEYWDKDGLVNIPHGSGVVPGTPRVMCTPCREKNSTGGKKIKFFGWLIPSLTPAEIEFFNVGKLVIFDEGIPSQTSRGKNTFNES